MNVFTYWEGANMPFINEVCVSSVRRIFGKAHRHLGTDDLKTMGIEIPPHIEHAPHRWVKFDYIRVALLQRFGGWWFDCDMLLFNDPALEVAGVLRKAWYQEAMLLDNRYGLEDRPFYSPMLDLGVLYSDPGSRWMDLSVEKFMEQKMYDEAHWSGGVHIEFAANWINAHGAPEDQISLGSFPCFYNVSDWWWDWVGKSCFNPDAPGQYGISLYTHSIRCKGSVNEYHQGPGDPYTISEQILNLSSHEEVLRRFPDSILAEYIRRFC